MRYSIIFFMASFFIFIVACGDKNIDPSIDSVEYHTANEQSAEVEPSTIPQDSETEYIDTNKTGDIEFHISGGEINVQYIQNDIVYELASFMNIDYFGRHLFTYPNGSIIGKLPSISNTRKPRTHLDTSGDFQLFFIDRLSGEITQILTNVGFQIVICGDYTNFGYWVLSNDDSQYELFNIEEDGSLTFSFHVPLDFLPELISITTLEENEYSFEFSTLTDRIVYKLDLDAQVLSPSANE